MEKYVFCFWLCYFSTWFLFFSGFYVFFLYLGFSGFLFLWRINYVPFVVLVFVVFFNGFLCFLCFLVCFALWGCVGPLVFAGSWFCIFYLNSINMFLRRDWHMFSSSVLTSLFLHSENSVSGHLLKFIFNYIYLVCVSQQIHLWGKYWFIIWTYITAIGK